MSSSKSSGEGFLLGETTPKKLEAGVYEMETHEGWFGAVGLFGGYVNAIILNAMQAEVDDPPRLPRSFVNHFLRPYPAGKMRIQTQVERSGSSVSVLTFKAYTDDVLCGVGTGTFGKNREASEYTHLLPPKTLGAQPFDEQEAAFRAKPPFEHDLVFIENFKVGVLNRELAEEASEIHAWVKSAKGDRPNNLFQIAAADAIPPVIFSRKSFGTHFAGTMDFVAHFRNPEVELEPGAPIFGRLTTAAAAHGYVDEDCELFSEAGELLLQSRQMRFIQRVNEDQAKNLRLK